MSIEGRTERTAKEDPTKAGHTCPYNGFRFTDQPEETKLYYCGQGGVLCDLCREDRADRRNRELVEGLALVAVFSIPENLLEAMAAGDMFGGDEADGREFMARAARAYAAALRKREGGEG